jgi:hypothetical protein
MTVQEQIVDELLPVYLDRKIAAATEKLNDSQAPSY